MATDYKKSHDRYFKYQKKIEDLLDRERPADKRDLQQFKDKKLAAYVSIVIRYFPFSLWMYRFDDLQKRSLTVNINSYRFQRNKHEEDVVEQLNQIRSRASGRALINEIEDTGQTLFILPFWRFGRTPLKNKEVSAFFGELGSNSTAQRLGPPDAHKRSDSGIQFTASMWGERNFDPKANLSTGTSGAVGPGTGPDDVLFHEMVHGSRMMRGVAVDTKVDKDYDDVEEYIAIILANIFIAEKRQRKLRINHHSHGELPNPRAFLNNAQHVNLSPRQLLRQFHNDQQEFFRKLACIPEADAWWNPVRDLGAEMGIRCPGRPGRAT